jgi:uncharacterized protein YecE (DUF72 family)
MGIRVGTSGWSYKEWKGSFYPKDLPANQMLRFYSESFSAVEVNNTFYRMPNPKTLRNWTKEVPKNFVFALKAPGQITHMKRLKNVEEPLRHFLKTSKILRNQLGPLLFQLPPSFKKDLPRLRDFLQLLPAGVRTAFEFRHPTWFSDEVYSLLHEHDAAWCVADTGERKDPPFESTASWGYLRLRRKNYERSALRSWAGRVRKQRWKECFIFFKHEESGTAPRFAKLMSQLLRR